MESLVRLRKTGLGWEFETESTLEDFVWLNLQELLGLTPLKRQYRVKEQICDIIAIDKSKRLVVLELKNNEDRYIVQQLTRYYDTLLEEKPFQEQINYDRPVQLVAIAPSFHRDTFLDRKYHSLDFNFVRFEVIESERIFYLCLKNLETEKISKLNFNYREEGSIKNISSPPRKLLNFLAKCNRCSDRGKENILNIRQKILSFDPRMQEVIKSYKIEYGKGKNNPCAELYFKSNSGFQDGLHLFLRLPEPSIGHRQTVRRLNVLTDKNWENFSEMIFYRKAFIYDAAGSGYRYYFPQFIDLIERGFEFEECIEKAQICYNKYKTIIEARDNSVEILLEIALETWLKRL